MLTTILVPFANKVYEVVSYGPYSLNLVPRPAFDCGKVFERRKTKDNQENKSER